MKLKLAAIVAMSSSGVLLSACTAADHMPTRTTTSTIYSNLTVEHPATWRLITPESMSAGPSGPVAYLTNQPTVSQCSTTHGVAGAYSTTCGSPVESLTPNGVFIRFTGVFTGQRSPETHNRVLGGHLATVQPVSPLTDQCPAGATSDIQMNVFLPEPDATPAGSGQTVAMSACYAGPNTTSITSDVNALIESVSFT